MIEMKSLLAALALTTAMTGAALAADPLSPTPLAPVYDPGFDWSGIYVGLNGGYGWGEAYGEDGEVLLDFDGVSGFVGGGQLGVNIQNCDFVFGAETDLQLASLFQEDPDLVGASVGLDYFGTIRARVGYGPKQFMPYVTGGIAYGSATVELNGVADTNTHIGWTAGGGIEVALDEGVSFKGEYLYTDLGTASYANGGAPADAGLRFHTLRAGVNLRF
jgi:outer membrane immunogenic protein